MTGIDLIALGVVALAALLGLRQGLIASALSAAGIVAGAVIGSRVAPHVLSGDSRYTPLVGLGGAAVGALVLEMAGSAAARMLRRSIALTPLRAVDALGGLALGAATGLAVVWVLGAVALYVPGHDEWRRDAQRSEVLQRLNAVVPPSRLMEAIQRVDPFPAIAGPSAPVAPPDPRVLRLPGVRRAAPSVVKVEGDACGLAVSGSGWVARHEFVVTAAHVVAGQSETTVEAPGGGRYRAVAVAFDRRNDVAVLRVPGLRRRPLAIAEPRAGEPVAILGYPESGPFAAVPGRVGRTGVVLSDDAYGQGPVARSVTSLRGLVRHGNSGGPVVDARGAVEATVYAARIGSKGGYAVPPGPVRKALAGARGRVSTGECAR